MPTDYNTYASNVNTLGIDETFPIAGQNNSSQGFRDNFKSIKTKIAQVAVELSELRAYVLKRIDEGETFDHDNDVKFFKLYRAQLKAYSETFIDLGTQGPVVTVNFLNGNFQKVTLRETSDLSFLGFPDHTAVGRLTLWITVPDAAYRLFIPNDVIYGTNVSYVQTGKIVFPTPGNYLLEFISVNQSNQFWLVGVQGLTNVTGAGGAGYTLPTASVATLGGVRIDGTTIGINSNGVISIIGGVPFLSDARFKQNISTIGSALDKVKQLRGVYYEMNGRAGTGVIAQEVEKVLPEVVETTDDVKRVHYGHMVGLLIESIKELEQQIQDLKHAKP